MLSCGKVKSHNCQSLMLSQILKVVAASQHEHQITYPRRIVCVYEGGAGIALRFLATMPVDASRAIWSRYGIHATKPKHLFYFP